MPASKHPGNLFGAPLATQQVRDSGHVLGAETRPPAASVAARDGVAVSLLGLVVAVVAGRVLHLLCESADPNDAVNLRRSPPAQNRAGATMRKRKSGMSADSDRAL